MAGATGVSRRAFVDLDVIRSNAVDAATATLPDCTADLRADAYGHGLIPVARTLTDAGIGGFLVSRVEDASALADEGIPVPAHVGSPAGRHAAVAPNVLGPELFGLGASHRTRAALRLTGEIIAVKRVGAGRGVSYGYTYRTSAETNLALVTLGYADGVSRAAGNTVRASIGGTARTIAGRVAMDAFMLDLGPDAPKLGTQVTVLGDARRGEPTAHEHAEALGTHGAEITTRLTARPRRQAKGGVA